MKVFVTALCDKTERLATMFVPLLHAYLKTDGSREKIRTDLEEMYGKTFKKESKVRFEDECEECGLLMEAFLCSNVKCSKGFPSDADLRILMRDHPHGKDEKAEEYIRRVEQIWRQDYELQVKKGDTFYKRK